MKDSRHFYRQRRRASGTPVPSQLFSPRPFVPVDLSASDDLALSVDLSASDDLALSLERGMSFGLSFEDIAIHSPNREGVARNDQEENTTGLPDHLKAGIEDLSGLSLDDVQVHYHSSQPTEVQALAYAQGTEIHVGAGQEKHLAHEAWHIVQQKQGRVRPTLQARDAVINDDEALENEAEAMGSKALQMDRMHPSMPQIFQTSLTPTLHHELTHHSSGSLSQQPIQRVVTIDPQIDPQTKTAVVDAVINHAEYAPWISILGFLPNVELKITVENIAQLGSTAVTEINNQPIAGNIQNSAAWAAQIAQQGVPVKILVKITPEKPKRMMASLMHELTLHAIPIAQSISALKTNPNLAQSQKNLHAENIIQGEDAQHSTRPAWIEYLNKAVGIGNDYKSKGEQKKGYQIIVEATNDAMTHTDPNATVDLSPLMSPQDKLFVFNYADNLGVLEDQYRKANGF